MEDKYIKLSDAKNAIADYIAEQTVSKYGSLEACMDAKFAAQGAMKELDYIPTADVVPKAEVEQLELKLVGVMWSADKWLDGEELEQDEVNRAATMREKTLRIVEGYQAQIRATIDFYEKREKEIFEEIDKIIEKHHSECYEYEDGDECDTAITYISYISVDIDDLKKKYTEGGTLIDNI